MAEWRYSFTILNLGTRCRCGQHHAPATLLPEEELGWPQSRSGRCGEERHLLPLPGMLTAVLQPVARRHISGYN
jgi:hypothetical protein